VTDPLEHLKPVERDCVRRYVSLLVDRLGPHLLEVRVFGSAARGDMWSERFPIRSDIDLIVVTKEELPKETQEELINETYPLFLECGRQIGPQWRSAEQWATPTDERAETFKANVEAEGRPLYP
jgi:predicted nucleotidyltransferase